MKKIVVSAAVGLLIGVLVAEFFPNIGKTEAASGLSNLAYNLGKQKPYLNYGAIGAVVGALVGALTGGR